MEVQIIDTPFEITVYGYSGIVENKNYSATGLQLMNSLWQCIKSNNLKNKGQNIWVYPDPHLLFTGIELENDPPPNLGLEKKILHLSKYAYYKHIGPYSNLSTAYSKMNDYLSAKEISFAFPKLEIYGHWTSDESKLETEILFNLL